MKYARNGRGWHRKAEMGYVEFGADFQLAEIYLPATQTSTHDSRLKFNPETDAEGKTLYTDAYRGVGRFRNIGDIYIGSLNENHLQYCWLTAEQQEDGSWHLERHTGDLADGQIVKTGSNVYVIDSMASVEMASNFLKWVTAGLKNEQGLAKIEPPSEAARIVKPYMNIPQAPRQDQTAKLLYPHLP